MKLTYIFHSGFAVETQSCVLVFDYWMDPADCMPVILSKGKPVYVLVSHFHEDHFPWCKTVHRAIPDRSVCPNAFCGKWFQKRLAYERVYRCCTNSVLEDST